MSIIKEESLEWAKFNAEIDLKNRELALKERELLHEISKNKGPNFFSPLVGSILVAAIGLSGNAIVTFINGKNSINLEKNKAEAARILKSIETGDPSKAIKNLELLVEADLVETHKEGIKNYILRHEGGTGGALPISITTSEISVNNRSSKEQGARNGVRFNAYQAHEELAYPGNLKVGANGFNVRKVQEWLVLRGYPVGYIDGNWGQFSHNLLQAFQGDEELPQTSELNKETWEALTRPMSKVLKPAEDSVNLAQALVNRANMHLSQAPLEVGGSNAGPWVRLYMNGNDGAAWSWSGGFVSFLVEQAKIDAGESDLNLKSLNIDTLARQAMEAGLFRDSASGYLPKPGDVFLLRIAPEDWRHCGIVVSVGANGTIEVIEGNANYNHSADGFAVVKVVRNISSKVDFISLEDYGSISK